MFALTDPSPDWSTATCVVLGVSPETMQPERATRADVAEATALCVGCPMFTDCLQHARSQAEPYGIHAGKWWGDEPTWLTECAADGCDELAAGTYCSARCRVAAYRARGRVSA